MRVSPYAEDRPKWRPRCKGMNTKGTGGSKKLCNKQRWQRRSKR